jgi:hypothetical protein
MSRADVADVRLGRARPVSTPSDKAALVATLLYPLGSALSCVPCDEFTDFERIPTGVSIRPAQKSKSAVSTDSTIIPRNVSPPKGEAPGIAPEGCTIPTKWTVRWYLR